MKPELEAALAEPVMTIALCWKLTREDGLVLGFTSHDRNLLIDGVSYVSRPGMTPSAISHSADVSAESMEILGAISSQGLTETDLESGRWSGARVELFACDWSRPESGTLRLLRGELGAVARSGVGFSETFHAELLSDLVELERMKPLRLSPTCRAELGDGRCGIDMRLYQREIRASGWNGAQIMLDDELLHPENYELGRMRWVSGPLAGLDRRIASATSAELLLEEPLPELMSEAGKIWIWEGCDKRLTTCAQRFSNVDAFDGEPHVPGTDALIRYGDA